MGLFVNFKLSSALAATAAAVLSLTAPATSHAGVLVASGDEWLLSNHAYGAPYQAGTVAFVNDLAATFGGSKYLLLTGNSNVPQGLLTQFATQLDGLGKTVAYATSFDLATASTYDAVFHFGQILNTSQLKTYIDGGGDAFVSLGAGYQGTAAAEAAAWNPFLAEYGLVAGSTWFPGAGFVSATVTQGPVGATNLIWGYGQSIEKLTPNASSVSYVRGSFAGGPTDIGLIGASQRLGPAGVPEPGAWVLMIGGFGLVGARLRRRASAWG